MMLSVLHVFGQTNNASYYSTGIPVVEIQTEGGKDVSSKIDYLKSQILIINQEDTLLMDSVQIRGRGNSTWAQPKKQYKLKFYEGKSPFNMNSNKTWALVGNYVDKSLMRNAIAFKLSEILEFPWSPKGEFVELVINGDHLGTYMFCETVKKGKNRLDIDDTGFFVEDDWHYKEEPLYFISEDYGYGISFKYPDEDEINEDEMTYIQGTINDLEHRLKEYESSGSHSYIDNIDIESFARFFYHTNVLMNMDPNRWYVKYDNTDDSKLQMGPPWDFEWCLGTGWYNGDEHRNPEHKLVAKSYLRIIMNDPVLLEEVAKIHRKYKEAVVVGILEYYNQLTTLLAKSAELNFQRWDILDKKITFNHAPCGSWIDEVNCDIAWFKEHQAWLDKKLTPYAMGIFTCQSSCDDNKVYNISGTQTTSFGKPGIYIKNKKKIVIK